MCSAESLKTRFQRENFSVDSITHFDHLPSLPESANFDLVLLDADLPGLSAEDPRHPFLHRWPDSCLILLSVRAGIEEKIRGLNSGANDFLGKPFDVEELIAPANAVLRRRNRSHQDVLTLKDLQVNRVSHQVRRAGRTIDLSPEGICPP
jgi:two-component system, OmpR family, response regulator